MQVVSASGTSNDPLPVLVDDGSRLDWLNATYSVTVAFQRQAGAIIHELRDSPEIEALLNLGEARFATEIRCPRTMLSRIEYGIGAEQVFKLDEAEYKEELYLIPGVLAVQDTNVEASGLHPLIRGTRTSIDIPAGYWLARAGEFRHKPLLVNLLKFVKDSDGLLNAGMMSVEEADLSGNPYFRVTLAAELYDYRREDRNIQIAALTAAFGRLPHSTMAANGENARCPIALALRSTFENLELEDWDSEFFDPAIAATSIEPFWVDAGDDEG